LHWFVLLSFSDF